MRPLMLDDLLPLAEYTARRREFLDAHLRYLDQYRLIRLGPQLTLSFENRQTLWFRVQEILRVARLGEPRRVQAELNLYNRLLPGRDQLQAALLIEVAEETRLTEELAPWQSLDGESIVLRTGSLRVPAQLITCRPEDRCLGMAHWLRFAIPEESRSLLGDDSVPVNIEIDHPGYRYESPPLSEEVRESLLADLKSS